jgi:hypothetical protein
MLRNSNEVFIAQSTSRKFLDTLEDLLLGSKTNPVVKERVLDVLGAAAFASASSESPIHIVPRPVVRPALYRKRHWFQRFMEESQAT